MNNFEKGRIGEQIAFKYIVSNGGNVIEKNYRTKMGEIDLIVRTDKELIFVEVKSRSNINYGYPAESVNYKKQRKIINTAKYYILQNSLHNLSVRFDVIEVYFNEKKINHIKNAF